MPRGLTPPPWRARDSLELASLASSSPDLEDKASGLSSPSGVPSSRKISSEDGTEQGPHARSLSVSSAFEFTSNLFPLSSTAAGYSALGSAGIQPERGEGSTLERHKTLTFLNGLSLVVGLIIGSGIFSSPAQVNLNAGSYGASLIVWGVSGLLVWTGAASYAELGGAIPLNGGSQVYLSKIYGELAGFLFSWCAVFVLKPGSSAIIAIIFGEYVVRAIVGADEAPLAWPNKAVAILGLALVTVLNCVSTKVGTRLGDVLMFTKFLALLAITIIGIVLAATGASPNTEWKTQEWFAGTSHDPSAWAVALYAGLWAYDGWDNTNYVVGELVNPNRDLPRIIHTAMPLVLLSYLAANISYILVLPKQVITSSNTIAVKFGSVVFGSAGSVILALIVSASCLGALNAQTFTSGRLVHAAGKEGFLPAFLGNTGMPGGTGLTPINAMAANAVLTTAYILVGEFGTLITFSGVAAYTFYFLTVLGLIILRIREPYLERPYRTWITTPVIFCCVSLFLLSRAVFAKPAQVGIVLGFVAVGVPVYFWRIRGRNGARKQGSDPWWKFWT